MNIVLLVIACVAIWLMSLPLVLAALFVAGIVWLIAIPFRILSIVVGALLALLRALLFLPARMLGWRH
jgi:hypothetical protein